MTRDVWWKLYGLGLELRNDCRGQDLIEYALMAGFIVCGVVTLAPQPYCKLHYLVARAGHDSPGLPSELDIVDTTLHLEGTVRAPGASTDAPLTIHTAAAYGQLFERAGNPAVELHADPGDGALRVEVRRHLARMFDGVDFGRMPERAIALQILKALVDHTDVAILPLDGKH